MTRVGFTGTRAGMTPTQAAGLRSILELEGVSEFHHGDCIGADAEADAIARELGVPVIVHPPADPKARAFCGLPWEARPPKPYIRRNHDIVMETEVLVAAPRTIDEELRSGTWATIRYALRFGRPVRMLHPKET